MKSLCVSAVACVLAMLGGVGYAGGMNFNATIEKGPYFMLEQQYAIIRSVDDMERYVVDIMLNLLRDDAEVPPGYWEGIESQLREQYARFDAAFFANRILVVALIEQGSGNVRYQVQGVELVDGELRVDVLRDAPLIQTMDFVSWVLFLELEKQSFDGVRALSVVLR